MPNVCRFLPLALVVAVSVAGCSGRPAAAPESTSFSGSVRTAAGTPVGPVLVHFHPLAPGFACAAEVALVIE